MENPATWGKAEHVVHRALVEAEEALDRGVIGLSKVRQITDALRREGLLVEEAKDKDPVRDLVDLDKYDVVMPDGKPEKVPRNKCRCPILRVGDFCPVHGG